MKAQGLPLNTIIIAIIAIVVLLVVLFIFIGVAPKPVGLIKECGEGIYADAACVEPGSSGYTNICVKTSECPAEDATGTEGEKRCCVREG